MTQAGPGELDPQNPEVGLKLARLLGEHLRRCEEARSDLIYKEVPVRLAGLLQRLVESEGVVSAKGYKLPIRYTHKELGSIDRRQARGHYPGPQEAAGIGCCGVQGRPHLRDGPGVPRRCRKLEEGRVGHARGVVVLW